MRPYLAGALADEQAPTALPTSTLVISPAAHIASTLALLPATLTASTLALTPTALSLGYLRISPSRTTNAPPRPPSPPPGEKWRASPSPTGESTYRCRALGQPAGLGQPAHSCPGTTARNPTLKGEHGGTQHAQAPEQWWRRRGGTR